MFEYLPYVVLGVAAGLPGLFLAIAMIQSTKPVCLVGCTGCTVCTKKRAERRGGGEAQ